VSADHQSSANKPNACKSGGPRTAAGKKNASRNALRHGLSAVVHRQPAPSTTIERLAKAICGESECTELLAQARLIAINALVLRATAAQRMAVVERLRESSAIALAKGDNSLDLAKARSIQTWLARREIDELVPKVLKKYNNELKSKKQALDLKLIVPGHIFSLLDWSDSIEHEQHALETAQKLVEQNERDEFEALEESAVDLVRLERYERRCWSQQKRAIRNFMYLKMIGDADRDSVRQAAGKSVMGTSANNAVTP
jgi:hypothetical protein